MEVVNVYFFISLILLLISFVLSRWNPRLRKLLIITTTLISITYIIWRITVIPTNNLFNFVFGVILYLAEVIGICQFFIFKFLFIRKYELEKMDINDFNKDIPFVDILICTYNESVDLLEKTIIAANNIDYPRNKFAIYICDDGKRDEVNILCKEHGVNWITRNSNKGAKAGNINNALKKIKGDLFAVLDADMIPRKDFLQKTVGYFVDESVAFVQTPQVYYNQDMYQYNLKTNRPNEQDFFMRDVEEARASVNAVLHVGTNAIFRKSYVDDIGGYPTYSITEDMAVGMMLQANGYKGIFINEALALGLSAETYEDLVKQRDRWCRGNLQVFKHFNIIANKGLSLAQKISYFDGILYWFSSIQKMIYIIAPLLYLSFNVLIVDTKVDTLLKVFTPFFLGQILIFRSLSNKTRSLKWSHFYEIAMAPHISLSILKELLGLKIKFNVTPKDKVNEKGYYQFKMAIPHIVLSIFIFISIFVGFIALKNGERNLYSYIINIMWTSYNLFGITVALRVAYQKPITKDNEKVVINGEIRCNLLDIDTREKIPAKIIDLTDRAMRIKIENDFLEINKNKKYLISINDSINALVNVLKKSNSDFIIKYEALNKKEMLFLKKLYVENIKPYYNVNRTANYIDRKGKEIIIGENTSKKSVSA